MSNLTTAITIVMAINVLFFLGQIAIIEINPEGTKFYECEGTVIADFEVEECQGEVYQLDGEEGTEEGVPEGETAISPEEGSNPITDTFTSARSWILDTTGVNYLYSVITAPTSFLASIGLPSAFVFGVGTLWYGVTFFLFVSWLLGRRH